MTDISTPCIEWTGCVAPNGYGKVFSQGRQRTAHRVAWEEAYGPVAKGLDVCHHCDNRRCVNLAHLFVGTRADNMRDAAAKRRTTHGERSWSAKLTASQVREIRQLTAEGVGQRELARRFGVTQGTIWPLLRGRTWRYV